jgi:hypothetical protein
MNTPTPSYRELVELLAGKDFGFNLGCSATEVDSSTLFTRALAHIQDLQRSLAVESQRVRFREQELQGMRMDRNHWRSLVDDMREANKRLVESESRLKAQLARLAPPEALFKPGQIVVRKTQGTAYTIHFRKYDDETRSWQYSNSREEAWAIWTPEHELRAQTAEEKGDWTPEGTIPGGK